MSNQHSNKAGVVYLVGAGPGDPGLITVRGLELLKSAEVVMYDRLVDERFLSKVPAGAEMIDVGKVRGQRGGRQGETNDLLVKKAREGKRVVRLKGGDPFVFGRGGEEAQSLAEAGIRFEVVPGVTSAGAAPAYAGIPLTYRGLASSVAIVTGSEAPEKGGGSVPWGVLANTKGTLVILMGRENLQTIAESLLRHGQNPNTPVALVQWGTETYQRTVVGTLKDIGTRACREQLDSPIVVVVGDVVNLREKLRWFDTRPLFGKRILVTRSRAQASTLTDLLLREGATALEVPTIEISPLDDYKELDGALSGLSEYAWVVFPSANVVDVVFERLARAGHDTRVFGCTRVAAIGSATAARLKAQGIIADFVPREFVSESVAEGLRTYITVGERVLLPQADISRDSLLEGLSASGANVHAVTAYKTSVPRDSAEQVKEILADGIDAATFTSSSTVKNLIELIGENLDLLTGVKIACIGPITAEAVRESGLKPDIVAKQYTVSGLVDALEVFFEEVR